LGGPPLLSPDNRQKSPAAFTSVYTWLTERLRDDRPAMIKGEAAMSREAANQALTGTDWTGASVEREVRPASVVHSVRLPAELSRTLEAEADRRGTTPSGLIRDLIAAALSGAGQDETVTVRIADLHRAIDQALVHAA
jgi:hypothetical protein